jgi:hypothetical protein
VLSMVNPMEHELRHMNDVSEREKAQQAHQEFENLADDAPKVRHTHTHALTLLPILRGTSSIVRRCHMLGRVSAGLTVCVYVCVRVRDVWCAAVTGTIHVREQGGAVGERGDLRGAGESGQRRARRHGLARSEPRLKVPSRHIVLLHTHQSINARVQS